jgi:hypothetical protein
MQQKPVYRPKTWMVVGALAFWAPICWWLLS